LGKLGKILIRQEKHFVTMALVDGIVGFEVRDTDGVAARQTARYGAADKRGGFQLAHGAWHCARQRLQLVVRLHAA
jgi:hypothetical protein